MSTTIIDQSTADVNWDALSPEQVVARMHVDGERGLEAAEVQARLTQFGRNEIASEPPPTLWEVAKGQLMNQMNVMLLIVSIATFATGQVATGAVARSCRST